MHDSKTLQAHGLKPDEYERIMKLLGREPNLVELGMFSVMWSEHCSYKSTRIHLKTQIAGLCKTQAKCRRTVFYRQRDRPVVRNDR